MTRKAPAGWTQACIVLRLTSTVRGIRRWRILLTGDAEEESWRSMTNRGQSISARILKVSHHGAINGTPRWVVQRIRPRYSVISNGQLYGHPTEAVYRRLHSRHENRIFCTEKNEDARKPSGCKEFTCPKSEGPGPLSLLLRPRKRPHVEEEPSDSFCTDVLQRELGT